MSSKAAGETRRRPHKSCPACVEIPKSSLLSPLVWYNTVKDKIYNEMFRERLFEKFDGFVKKMNMFLFSDGQLGLALAESQTAYYDNNQITAEECARQMQERAEIYLKE